MRRIPRWVGRVAGAAATLLVAAWVVGGWLYADALRDAWLVPRSADQARDLEVGQVASGRIVLPRTAATVRPGVWGIDAARGYGQATDVVGVTEETVERVFRTLSGVVDAGDAARMDRFAYPDDPEAAHGIGFEAVRYATDLGPNPAWLIDGRRSTWIVFAHDDGADRREALRLIPSLLEQGFPVLVVTYRNDEGAPRSPGGLRTWGIEEWRDLEGALGLARRKGAGDWVLVGSGMGAQVIARYLDRGSDVGRVRGVILDGPILDLEAAVSARRPRWLPAPVAWLGRQIVRLRWGIEWSALDQVGRADRLDVPVLVLHGGEDPVAPVEVSERFAAARPDLVTLVRVEQGRHGDLWNLDPERYQAAVAEFLLRVVGSE